MGPTSSRPTGPPAPLAASTAVITFGRRAAGGRAVIAPITGAWIIGTKNPQRTTASTATGHEIGATTIQSGNVAAKMPKLASRIGGNRSSSFTTSTEPAMAPTPKPAKIQPKTCGSRSYLV